jgi:hypothetical protein
MVAVKDDVGRVGDRQHEARRIGDEGADEQVGQRLDLRRLGRGVDRRRQDHRGGVVGQEGRHHRADDVDEQEQALGRAVGAVDGGRRHPIEQAFAPGDL